VTALAQEIPELHLTQGQLLWAIKYGREPDARLKYQVRYLRALDIPPASAKQASGPGKRITYDFFDLIEAGVAITGLDLGFRPKDIAAVLVEQRETMRRVYADAWRELPDLALTQEWVRSRGRVGVLMDEEIYIRLHDRRSDRWGELDLIKRLEIDGTLRIFEPVERFFREAPRRLLPLKRLMLQWVAWALEAPEIKPGRK